MQDIALHQQLSLHYVQHSFFNGLKIFVTSRGLLFTCFYRIIYYSTNNKNLLSLKWWLARIIEAPAAYLGIVVCKCDVLGDCKIDGGVYLSNKGYITCGAQSIGSGSIIHDHVTFGLAVGDKASGRPRLGNGVWVGPNSVIVGDIQVGDGATLLPGTFLTFSVPAGAVVRGNPARIIREKFDNSPLRQSLEIIHSIP